MKEYWKEVLIATLITVVGAVVTWILQSSQEDKSPTIVVIPQSQKSTNTTPITNPNSATPPKIPTTSGLTTQTQAEQDKLAKLRQQQELEQQRANLAKLQQELEVEAEKLRKLKQQQELEQRRANLAKLKQEQEDEAVRLRELKQQQELEQQRASLSKLKQQQEAEAEKLRKLKQQQELEQRRANLAKLKQEQEAEAVRLRELKQQQELEQQRASLAKLKQEREAEEERLRRLKVTVQSPPPSVTNNQEVMPKTAGGAEQLHQQTVEQPRSSELNWGDFLAEADLTAQQERQRKAKWDKWQLKMQRDFDQVMKFMQQHPQADKAHHKAWQQFLRVYAKDNPYSQKDEDMRTT
ncbi:hypothetical protein TI05_11210 [Achromatium sp. WMS3]|nr:hypothetical protein TI05_11210 [Achromatium sp. WMS3]